ncbi:HD domain-containing phosphohydrolase [Chloroflexota bacterium]
MYAFCDMVVSLFFYAINMPDISGVELSPKIKARYPDAPIVVAIAVGGTSVSRGCMKLGAYEYISKPFILEEGVLTVGRVLARRRVELSKKEYQQYLEDKVGEQAEKIRDLFLHAVTALAHALEAKDKYTGGHSQRVAEISVAIAKEMRLPEESIARINLAGLLHDIGKIGMSEFVLNKPNSLTSKEFQHVQNHPEIGEHILAPIVSDNQLLKLVRNHHERYDGTGYPDQLKNTQIPLGARILAVSDAYDAMISERPYQKAISNKVAYTKIEQGKETQFDPEVVVAVYRLQNRDILVPKILKYF